MWKLGLQFNNQFGDWRTINFCKYELIKCWLHIGTIHQLKVIGIFRVYSLNRQIPCKIQADNESRAATSKDGTSTFLVCPHHAICVSRHFTLFPVCAYRHATHLCTQAFYFFLFSLRYAVDFPHLDKNHNFKEMEVKPLEMDEAVKLLTKSVMQGHRDQLQVKGQKLITEENAIKLAEHCGNNPQALRAVASQLRSGKKPEMVERLLANPSKMKLVLNDQSLWGLGQDATAESAEGSRQVRRLKSKADCIMATVIIP